MYKNKSKGGFQAMEETEVAIPVKKEHKSIFAQQLNNNFSKEVDDTLVIESAKPDLEKQQALEEL